MGSKWPEFRLDEITTLIIDCPHSTPEWTDSGVIVLRSNNIRNGALDLANPSFTTEEGYLERIKRAIPAEDDLVLTREAPMGEVCIIPKALKCCLGQRMVLIRADKTQVIPEYLLYAIQSSYIQNQISWNEGTGTTVSNIRIPNIKALKIPLPSLNIQRGIASNLLSIDKKISLNIATNQTLEQMSQALFKSWFVDFDPVIDNALDAGNPTPEALQSRAKLRQKVRINADFEPLPANIRALFPAEFEETVLGWVPRGWKEGSITDIAFINSTSWGTKNQPDYVNYVDLSNANDGIISSIENIPFEDAPSRARRILKKNDLIFGLVRPANRSFAYVHVDGLTGSTGFAVVRAKNTIYKNFIYYFVTYDKNVEELARIADGGAYPAIKPDDICSLPLIIPPEEIVQRFDESTSRFRDLMNNSLVQNDYLTALRDTLLPKLISGELSLEDLPDLIKQTEPA
ncbi:TPA: restriction endonuclease subunit S [Enterobacter cancerogenus]